MIDREKLELLLKEALHEDIGDGDHSTLSAIPKDAKGTAVLKIKEECVIAGIEVARFIFQRANDSNRFETFVNDGDSVKNGDKAFIIQANVHDILQCERLVLNIMQRMSGIATLTKLYTDKLKGYKTQLLDTRKTTPNFRLLEKEAVRIGGGTNHRFGLYDMIMLKDNHIDFAGGIVKALDKAKHYLSENHLDLKIEVETRNLDEVKTVMKSGKADRIMLDNFKPDAIREALKIINGKAETEASGGINLENIQSYAATGVDFISSGALIHQAKSVDLSLKAVIDHG